MQDLGTLLAQGDIGQNALTGMSKVYQLGSVDVDGIMGTATFRERQNGEALAQIMLENTPDGGMHPAHIHINTAAEGGAIAFSFNPVDGTSGMSKTNIATFDDGTAITYEELLDFDGYINVHLSMDELATIVGQGDIGQNELTGESTTYNLREVDAPGISGTAEFKERANGSTLAIIMLENTPDDGMHPAHIHKNSAEMGGPIAFTFNPVDGASGMSMTNIMMLDDDTPISYDELLTYNGYINVHLSMEQLATIVAQGNFGSNSN
jgi:Cu/Zn superoxide dismutase